MERLNSEERERLYLSVQKGFADSLSIDRIDDICSENIFEMKPIEMLIRK